LRSVPQVELEPAHAEQSRAEQSRAEQSGASTRWGCASIAFAAILGVLAPHPARGQTYGDTLPCVPTGDVQRVYFNPGDLAAEGYDVALFRQSLIRAIAVWNEESHSRRRLVFDGDTTANSLLAPNTIVVSHTTANFRSPSVLAFTSVHNFTPNGFMGTCGAGTAVAVFLRQGLGTSTPTIPWTTHWTNGTKWSYEAIMIHELGHAAYGFGHTANGAPLGVMTPDIVLSSPIGRHLHLYKVDWDSAIQRGGLTLRSQATRLRSDFAGWSSSTELYGPPTTVGPGISWYTGPSQFVVTASPRTVPPSPAALRAGSAGGPWFSLSNAAVHPTDRNTWWSVAVSNFGEIVAVWHACNTGISGVCEPKYCYSPTLSAAGPWECGGFQPGDTFARVEVHYDRPRDRFVVIWLDSGSGHLRTVNRPAEPGGNWGVPVNAYTHTLVRPLRYMGGAFVETTGSPSAPTLRGSFFAAAAWEVVEAGQPLLNPLVEASVTFDGATQQYRIGLPELVNGATESGATRVTSRHFGVLRTGKVTVLAWLQPSLLPSGLTFALRSSWNAPFDASVTEAWPSDGLESSVDLAELGGSISHNFAVGVSAP
jgi:hypothetical protein